MIPHTNASIPFDCKMNWKNTEQTLDVVSDPNFLECIGIEHHVDVFTY